MGIFDKVKQAGEMGKMIQQAKAMQKALAAEKIEVEENGIKVVISGDMKIKELFINGEFNNKLTEVLNKALKKTQEVSAKKMQEMSGGLGGLMDMMR
ncbi:YbaB/EbfC family nucleoid-associated protein [Candidatus Beckwithbacteria bacterium]|nr:YbaB/EbfC family nucleoid-associated protein [Candidatus Beckwithbacteria bacterium]